jgi:maltose O-acetyltransferase
MDYRGQNINLKQVICLIIYYGLAQYLPISYKPLGRLLFAKHIRYFLCKQIFKSIGINVNIEKKSYFGSGLGVQIGDNSGIGVSCRIPDEIIIGKDVMMGPGCHIFSSNHNFNRKDIPIRLQGYQQNKLTVIDDDVWIGQNVTFTPGRHVAKGSVIGACTLLCKDFPEYSVVGGNPSKLISVRGMNNEI